MQPSKRDAQAAARGNQQAANELHQQGRESDARAAEKAAEYWRGYLARQ